MIRTARPNSQELVEECATPRRKNVRKCSPDICDKKWERWLIEVSASGSREKKQNKVKLARKRTHALVKGSPRKRPQEL